jgi:hypothetical protein
VVVSAIPFEKEPSQFIVRSSTQDGDEIFTVGAGHLVSFAAGDGSRLPSTNTGRG